ncbi:MAG: hypothetical protein R2849_16775 [Thermomicrobiales bacterium]
MISEASGSVVAPRVRVQNVPACGSKNPATRSVLQSASNGLTRRSIQFVSATVPASVTTTISPTAEEMAMFRPVEMLTEGAEITFNGKGISTASRSSSVPSLDPPSTTMHSSGYRVWFFNPSIQAGKLPYSFKTVATSDIRVRVIPNSRSVAP